MTSKVIVFSGMDGSGKSSHAYKIACNLKSHGKSVRYLWMSGRGKIFLSLPLLVLCRLLGVTKVHKLRNGIKACEYSFFAYKPLRLLWPWLQLIDSFLYSIMLVRDFLLRSCDFIIMDRSVIDTLVDTIADTHIPRSNSLLQTLFLALLPETSLVIVLDISVEVAVSRKGDILGAHYLKIRKRTYEYLAKKYGWYILSTEMEFNTIHDMLMKLIDKSLNEGFV